MSKYSDRYLTQVELEYDPKLAFNPNVSWEVFRWTAMNDYHLNIDAIIEQEPWKNK